MRHPTTDMITNNNNGVRESEKSTGPAMAAAVSSVEEVFPGIDTASVRHDVARFVLGEGVKPAEGMTTAMLLARVAKRRKAGARVHCVYEAGPTGFALARELLALGATCVVTRPRRLDRHGRRRKTDPLDAQHLAEDLAVHYFGGKGLLCPVRIPSVDEELRRLAVRERESLARTRHVAIGISGWKQRHGRHPPGLEPALPAFERGFQAIERGFHGIKCDSQAFERDLHPFERDSLLFECDLLPFERDSQAFERDLQSFERDSRMFERRSQVFERDSQAFKRDSQAFERQSQGFQPDFPAFEHDLQAFERRSHGVERDSQDIERHFPADERGSHAFEDESQRFARESQAFERDVQRLERRPNAHAEHPLTPSLHLHGRPG